MRASAFGISGLFFTAAAFLVFSGDSTALKATAFAIFGVACVIAVSLVFLAIGKQEDAEREAARRPEPEPPEDPHAGEAARRSRPRPPRRPT